MKQTVKDCHGKNVVEKAFAYLGKNSSTTEILHSAKVTQFCIPCSLTVGYKIIFNDRNKIWPEKVESMTSQRIRITVVCLLLYTAPSAGLQPFRLRCAQLYQGVHSMFRKNESRVSFEKATSVFKSGSFCSLMVVVSPL